MGMQGGDPHIERYNLMVHHISATVTFIILYRCYNIGQVNQYLMMARKIQHANGDIDIFKLTGCLSKCDRYHYTATPRFEIKDKGVANTTTNQIPNYYITFTFSSGLNEVKEQVECDQFNENWRHNLQTT